ncbi:MAG: TlpA family protein disulfide reductase [Planctomycetota bacterium]|jgi:hypothetical protein
MSGRRKKRSRKSGTNDFSPARKQAMALPAFVLIIISLLAAGGVWSVIRHRANQLASGPIVIDLVDNGSATIADVKRTQSWTRLEEVATELRVRLEGKSPQESWSLLQILEAVAARQGELANGETEQAKALANRLFALQGLSAADPDRESLMQRTAELSSLSTRYKDDPNDELSREAFRSALVASQLTLRDGINDEEDSQRLVVLIPSWIRQAAQRFPNDVEITRAIGDLLASYPNVSERDAQVKKIIESVEEAYRTSSNPLIVEWANLIAVKQFFDEFGLVRQLSDTLMGDLTRLDQLEATAERLLASKPTPVARQTALELAQFLEGFEQPDRARRILERLVAAAPGNPSETGAAADSQASSLGVDARRMLARQELFGQTPELALKLATGATCSREQLAESVVLLMFYRDLDDLEACAEQIGVLQRLQDQGLRLFLVGPQLSSEDRNQLSTAVFQGAPDPGLPFLEPAQSAELRETFHVTYTPFPVILDKGRIVSLGTPINRGLLWLEKRLFDK